MSLIPATILEGRLGIFGLCRRWWMLILFVLILVVVTTMALGPIHSNSATGDNAAFYEVEEGPLMISVLVSGTIRSSQAVVLKSEVEGRTSVLSLVDEGLQVKVGDLLIELDSSELEDEKHEQEIIVENAEAAFIQAREKLAVIQQEAEVDVDAAKVAYELAQLELNKYTDENGEFTQELRKAETTIIVAEAKLERAIDKVKWSMKLSQEGFITQSQLEADKLEKQETQVEIEIARGELRLLKEFTYKGKLAELQSSVKQKRFELAKTQHNVASNIVDAQATLRARETSRLREIEQMERIVTQIAKCRIVAPVDGMVVYASSNRRVWSSDEPLSEGVEVRQRQELIRLPTAQKMKADVKVHESMLKKVSQGLPTRITTGALPGTIFAGQVSKIAVLPDAQHRWLNPDLKVYNCEIEINGETTGLRPGNSCSAEIIVAEFAKARYVPIQAVLRVDGNATVYMDSATGPKAQRIEVGLDNNHMIQVLSGLEVGQKVLLSPPLQPSAMLKAAAQN